MSEKFQNQTIIELMYEKFELNPINLKIKECKELIEMQQQAIRDLLDLLKDCEKQI